MKADKRRVSRRSFIAGASLTTAGAVAATANAASASSEGARWDAEADILCIGSGAAALSAAVVAHGNGDEVIVLERRQALGGTTAKSGGVHWIPNNHLLRAKGIEDKKDDALAYMVRLGYPEYYTPGHPTLGIDKRRFALLSAFYDNGYKAVDRLLSLGAYKAMSFDYKIPEALKLPGPTLDYFEHAPEDKVKSGRSLTPMPGPGGGAGGSGLVTYLSNYLRGKSVPIRLGHRVIDVVQNARGEVVGVVAETSGGVVRLRARKAVVFGSGGFAHNHELMKRFQRSRIYGSCAGSGSTGDLIGIASRAGAALDNMTAAWRGECFIEEAFATDGVLPRVYFLPRGDSMMHVNLRGRRVVNEYRPYNTRPRIHDVYDPNEEEYPNHLLIQLYDRRCAELFGGNSTIPADDNRPKWVMSADTLEDLARVISARLEQLRGQSVAATLAPDFTSNLRETVKRFNQFARTGVDADFKRGADDYGVQSFVGLNPPRNASYKPMRNPTMYPLAANGPYYAAILGQGVLDTCGGPAVNEKAQILNHRDEPIPGLYGAGNCIAAPSGAAYFGTGGTIGPAMAFAYIAANVAHEEAVKLA
jgi:3-oxosteroid 1-dehydrogenase